MATWNLTFLFIFWLFYKQRHAIYLVFISNRYVRLFLITKMSRKNIYESFFQTIYIYIIIIKYLYAEDIFFTIIKAWLEKNVILTFKIIENYLFISYPFQNPLFNCKIRIYSRIKVRFNFETSTKFEKCKLWDYHHNCSFFIYYNPCLSYFSRYLYEIRIAYELFAILNGRTLRVLIPP